MMRNHTFPPFQPPKRKIRNPNARRCSYLLCLLGVGLRRLDLLEGLVVVFGGHSDGL